MKLLQETLRKIKPVSGTLDREIQRRLDNLTKPPGSLGRLEELALQLCRIRGEIAAGLRRKAIAVFAADHGVVAEGVSAYPQEVTAQMLLNFASGGAAINVLARHAGAEVIVVDVGVTGHGDLTGVPAAATRATSSRGHPVCAGAPQSNPHALTPPRAGVGDAQSQQLLLLDKKIAEGTANMARGAAMTREQAGKALEAGIETVEDLCARGPLDLLGLGEMGIGNTTAATAILAALGGEPVEKITGRGTGLDEAGRKRKIAAIEKALALNRPDPADPLDVLQKVGGFEIGAIAGAVLAAAARRIPVAVDGLISGAGALLAAAFSPACRDVCLASHLSVEPGHARMLERLNLKPYLDMNLRLGEGTGSALLMLLADSSLKILNEMATFDAAGISQKEKQ